MDNEFITSDFGLACFLRYSNLEISGLKNDPEARYKVKKLFCFKNSPELEKLLEEWRNGEAVVVLQKFIGVQRHMKAMLYDAIAETINR